MSQKDQRWFLRTVKKKCKLSWEELGRLCGTNGPTAKVNYFFRCNTLPLDGAKHLSYISGVAIPSHQLLPDNWGQIKGGKSFSRKMMLKNPNLCADLAELVGALLGDGCIFRCYSKNERKYVFFTLLTGHVHDEEYYQSRIRSIMRKLFSVNGHLHRRQNAIMLVFKSKRIYDFLKSIGIPEGKKIGSKALLIPKWIKSDPNFLKACVRGIADTDGSVFRSGKNGIRIQYKFASELLTKSLHNALTKLGYHPTRINKTGSFSRIRNKRYIGWRFYLSKLNEVDRFATEIGFENEWHRRRYRHLRGIT